MDRPLVSVMASSELRGRRTGRQQLDLVVSHCSSGHPMPVRLGAAKSLGAESPDPAWPAGSTSRSSVGTCAASEGRDERRLAASESLASRAAAL